MKIQHRYQLPELLIFYHLPLTAVTIGVAEGLFDRDLLMNGIEKLTSVDNWATIEGQKGDGGYEQEWHNKNYENAIKLLKPFGEKSLILKGLSHEVAKFVKDNSVSLLYLDGDHSYDGVKRDLATWVSKVAEGGIIAGHDYITYEGVNRAVNEFCEGKYDIHIIPEHSPENSSFWFRKI